MGRYEQIRNGAGNNKGQQQEYNKAEVSAGEIQPGDQEIEIKIKNGYNNGIKNKISLGGRICEIGPKGQRLGGEEQWQGQKYQACDHMQDNLSCFGIHAINVLTFGLCCRWCHTR